ncbi:MAG: hypothetical protein Q9173_002562, partial [Seirophora scorigena]
MTLVLEVMRIEIIALFHPKVAKKDNVLSTRFQGTLDRVHGVPAASESVQKNPQTETVSGTASESSVGSPELPDNGIVCPAQEWEVSKQNARDMAMKSSSEPDCSSEDLPGSPSPSPETPLDLPDAQSPPAKLSLWIAPMWKVGEMSRWKIAGGPRMDTMTPESYAQICGENHCIHMRKFMSNPRLSHGLLTGPDVSSPFWLERFFLTSCLTHKVYTTALVLMRMGNLPTLPPIGLDVKPLYRDMEPIQLAFHHRRLSIVKLFLSIRDSTKYCTNLAPEIQQAATMRDDAVLLASLLAIPGIGGNTFQYPGSKSPIHLACQYGSLECVTLLCKRGVDTEARDVYGKRAADYVPSQTKMLPVLVASSIRQCFTMDVSSLTYQQALKALDYLDDLEIMSKNSVKLTRHGLGLDKDTFSQSDHEPSSISPSITEWANHMQERCMAFESLYTKLYSRCRDRVSTITLLYDTTVMLRPFSQARMTLTPSMDFDEVQEMSTGSHDFLPLTTFETLHSAVFNDRVKIVNDIKRSNGAVPEDSPLNGKSTEWVIVLKILDLYLDTATSMIKDCSEITGPDSLYSCGNDYPRNRKVYVVRWVFHHCFGQCARDLLKTIAPIISRTHVLV